MIAIAVASMLYSSAAPQVAPYPTVPRSGETQQTGEPERPTEVARRALLRGDYVGAIYDLLDLESRFRDAGRTGRLLDALAPLYSFVGADHKAYETEARLLSELRSRADGPDPDVPNLTRSALDVLDPASAVDAIVESASKARVVMINEEHRTPAHRALVQQALGRLYAVGYRYLALEALDAADAEALNRRGYATHASGSYLNDPIFADLVRSALSVGFTLVAYEYEDACSPVPEAPFACQEAREAGQARNLFDRTIGRDPSSRVVVHVGRGHNAEDEGGPFSWMAVHFRRISRIDPFTVDQMESPRLASGDESPLYRYVTSRWNLVEPSVLQTADGVAWHDVGYDLTIFHPRRAEDGGRPRWLRMGGYRRPTVIDGARLRLETSGGALKATSPVLVQAFAEAEPDLAIPVDQILVEPGQTLPPLMLPKGEYRIRAVSRAGPILGGYALTID